MGILFSITFGLLVVWGWVAGIWTAITRSKDKKRIPETSADQVVKSLFNAKHKGLNGFQIVSFLFNLGLIGLAYMIVESRIALYNSSDPNDYQGIFIIALLLPVGLLSIGFNSVVFFSKDIREAEAYAIMNKTGNSFVIVQRITAWLVWLFYIALGTLLLLGPTLKLIPYTIPGFSL
jgi:hypothetical protein